MFIGSGIYRGSRYGDRHPLAIPRVPTAIDLARALGWLGPDQYRTSPRAKPAAMTGFHTGDYLAALQKAEQDGRVSDAVRHRHGLGTLSNPVFPEVWRRPATAVGGGMLAAELVRDGGIVFNPGGGTHHGMPDRAEGFCFLNEPVLTIQRLLAQGLTRVAYVDIDAHHGDGVEYAFAGSDKVRLVSVHEAMRWPFTGGLEDTAQGASYNLPVPRGFNDSEFALVLNELILPVVADFKPQAIFLQCGADAVLEDPLSRLALSNNSHWSTVRALMPMTPRLIVSGGGGYNPWTVGRLWAGVWATLSGQDIPDRLPPEAEAIQRSMAWPRKGRPDPVLLTTLRDAPRDGPVRDEIRSGVSALRQRLAAGG
ncbi:acetoin utilization protein AcuC [Pseudoprimorskyibacter insulae]|uniref:Acetoin utilization protein AcuC n=1 Tax=Pseudoprimorskyibacter insulae TaxID=1695997 RepID=A0A2R8AWM2_9RHOB|nr:Acetoin utilization protein AcuC [Pseudoprimorskyibacter insulae]